MVACLLEIMGDSAAAGGQRHCSNSQSAPCYSHTDIVLPLRWLGGRLRLRVGLRPELGVGWGDGADGSVLRSFRLAWGSEVTVRLLRLGVGSGRADDKVLLLATRRKTK